MSLLSSNYLRLSRLLFRFSLFSAILSFVITKYFVTLWVGSSNYAGMEIMFFLAISAFVFSAMSGCGIVIYISKKFEKWVFWSFAEIACAILLSYALYLIFGFIGLVSGYVLASMITPIYLLKIVLKQLHLSYTEFLKNVLQYCFVTNLSTIVIASFVISLVEISTWTELIGLCLLFIFFNIFCYEGFLILRSKEMGVNAKIASVFKLKS
jgi:O-antigen/teichoic acid export membrane protein